MTGVQTCALPISAADIPEIACACGAVVIHVNIEDVSLGGENELMLIGKATEVLEALLNELG